MEFLGAASEKSGPILMGDEAGSPAPWDRVHVWGTLLL